jgi:hypothetical protein
MRGYVAQASSKNEDVLHLHEEKPLSLEDQQALALASQMVSEDSMMTFQSAQPAIMGLVQKVQQLHQAQIEQQALADPTANVLMKTQMAETQRKSQEAQAYMQQEMQKQQQNFQLEVAKLQQQVQELQAKYTTQSNIDSQRNATDIALANINNAAKERIATITTGAQMDLQQQQLEHEQNLSAFEAIKAAEGDIREHGLAVQQQQFEQQAAQVDQQIEARRAEQQHRQQLTQAAQKHAMDMMQAQQQHNQAMQQAAMQQPQEIPPTEEQ